MENRDTEITVKDVIWVKVTKSKVTQNNKKEMINALNVQESSKIIDTIPIRNQDIKKKLDNNCVVKETQSALLNTAKPETKFTETTNLDEGKSI